MITRDMSHNVDPVSELAKQVHVLYEFGGPGATALAVLQDLHTLWCSWDYFHETNHGTGGI